MTETSFKPKGFNPTEAQTRIQLAKLKHVIVEANAGAAKTTTLALRIAQALHRGCQPANVLALTYTAPGCTALRQALRKMGVQADLIRGMRIHTFDEFSAKRLSLLEGIDVRLYGTFERVKPFVLQAVREAHTNPQELHPDEFDVAGTGEGDVEWLLSCFRRLKGTLTLVLDASERSMTPSFARELDLNYVMVKAFWKYEKIRADGDGAPRFRTPDDPTYDLARKLLDDEFTFESHPLDLKLNLILVDEMHDTNRAMFTVVQHLLKANPLAAFVGVGDRDQVIHAVAGAEAAFMGATFNEQIGQAVSFELPASFRFGPELAEPAGRLAGKTYRSGSPRSTKIELIGCDDSRQANERILEIIQSGDAKLARPDIAVLLRWPHQSVDLENQFLAFGIDYRTEGFKTYLMRPEVLFIRGLAAYANGDFDAVEHEDSRLGMVEALLLFSGSFIQKRVEKLDHDQFRQERLASLEIARAPSRWADFVEGQVLRNATPTAQRLIRDAVAAMKADPTPDGLLDRFVQALNPRMLASEVMVEAASVRQVQANIQGLIAASKKYDDAWSFFRGMNQQDLRLKAMKPDRGVVLSSIEAAKGLEFKHVLMPGLDKGVFALTGDDVDNRNLLYVGITRAKTRLTLLYDHARPSEFLFDAGLLDARRR